MQTWHVNPNRRRGISKPMSLPCKDGNRVRRQHERFSVHSMNGSRGKPSLYQPKVVWLGSWLIENRASGQLRPANHLRTVEAVFLLFGKQAFIEIGIGCVDLTTLPKLCGHACLLSNTNVCLEAPTKYTITNGALKVLVSNKCHSSVSFYELLCGKWVFGFGWLVSQSDRCPKPI